MGSPSNIPKIGVIYDINECDLNSTWGRINQNKTGKNDFFKKKNVVIKWNTVQNDLN